MKKIYIKFLLILSLFISINGFGWEGRDFTMFWQIENTGTSVDDSPNDIYTFLGFDHSDDELGVRIACYDNSGNLIKYLNPLYPEFGVDWEYNDQPIGTRDDLWMTRGSQAYYGSESYMERLFQMQVGNYDEDDNFIPILYTNSEIVNNKYWYDWGTTDPPEGDWTSTRFYTINPVVPSIPEPAAVLLMLIGVGLLGLRRRV